MSVSGVVMTGAWRGGAEEEWGWAEEGWGGGRESIVKWCDKGREDVCLSFELSLRE